MRVFALCLLLPLVSAFGCNSADNAITCADVCNRYQECIDEDYDVTDCVDRCESDASSDQDKERRLESCETCLDDRSCTESVFACTTECAGIVP
jgi:hypothetical protein